MIKKLLIILFILLRASLAQAADWYVSSTGSANCVSGCLTGARCSLATVLTCSVVGDDNVILQDGTYTETSLTVPWSGTEGHPITIKAENDGQAIVDCQSTGTCRPLFINTKSYIDVSGIVFKNTGSSAASGDVVRVYNSSHINLKKISAYNAYTSVSMNAGMFLVDTTSDYILLEDCVAGGTGRYGIIAHSSSYITIRRCYARMKSNNYGMGVGISLYNSTNSIVENSVVTVDSNPVYTYQGINAWGMYGTTSNNTYKGNVVFNVNEVAYVTMYSTDGAASNTTHNNNVCISPSLYCNQNNATSTNIQNMTSYGATYATGAHYINDGSMTFKNNSIITANYGYKYVGGTLSHTYNNFYNMTTGNYNGTTPDSTEYCDGTGCSQPAINPSYNTSFYGKGAYLIVPSALIGQGEAGGDIGAEVLYRYVDGTITGDPLWPWPMEARIFAETGYSVTYETNGGIWKTLTGVYGSDPPPPPPVVEKASIQGGASLSGGSICR